MKNQTWHLIKKLYPNGKHPYDIYHDSICKYLRKQDTVVDIGCGSTAPDLTRLSGLAGTLVGLDLVPFRCGNEALHLINASALQVPLADDTADMVISRSVLEHLPDPSLAFQEVSKILKYKGHFVFLTPNLYDYSTVASMVIPSRFHARIVSWAEGRDADDVFPTYYRANTSHKIGQLASQAGLSVCSLEYLGQYPCYLSFNPLLFGMGALYDKLICRYRPLRRLRSWILGVLEKGLLGPGCRTRQYS